ncbi:MAG TPA: GNAT family N-acetyltransferase [Candidatus Limnocylindrales bacterium]
MSASDVALEWRGGFESGEVEALHAEGFGHAIDTYDWRGQVERHSLGWVTARRGEQLVGWVNVAWDGGGHAFILDTLVAGSARRHGIGTRLVAIAAQEARTAGCEWLHVDFDEELRGFYFDACGFRSTPAGVIGLADMTAVGRSAVVDEPDEPYRT